MPLLMRNRRRRIRGNVIIVLIKQIRQKLGDFHFIKIRDAAQSRRKICIRESVPNM